MAMGRRAVDAAGNQIIVLEFGDLAVVEFADEPGSGYIARRYTDEAAESAKMQENNHGNTSTETQRKR